MTTPGEDTARRPIVPCIWLDDQAEAAARFYAATFPDGRLTAMSHYPESFDNPGRKPRGSVLTVEFEIAGQRFTALNGGPQFVINPSLSFFVHVQSADETDRLCATLGQGGRVLMAVGTYPWSERYGWVQDRFGVSWQVIAGRRDDQANVIVPCLMFAGAQHARAYEAMQHYAGIFPDGRISAAERYTAAEGPAGAIKHGRVSLGGQELITMDSHIDHGVTFNEGLSLQVMCKDQQVVDHYWTALSAGGQPGPCGWLKDRFGVSWQIVPEGITAWMASSDIAARDRAFRAMLSMQKLVIAALDAAFNRA